MAYGLRRIGHLRADGSGRDWFFIGDTQYRHGRTHAEFEHDVRKKNPSVWKTLPPSHIARNNAKAKALGQVEKWKTYQDMPCCGTLPSSFMRSEITTAPRRMRGCFETTYSELGRAPAFNPKEPSLGMPAKHASKLKRE